MSAVNFSSEAEWEAAWAPYDEPTYRAVYQRISPEDVVLEIGAGDLRLALLLAGKACQVFAIENQSDLVRLAREKVLRAGRVWPESLVVIEGDARQAPFPSLVTCAVLLMRHCCSFRIYAEKLKAIGCRSLITNARWRVGVEEILLQAPRLPFAGFPLGWYACWCGWVGFKQGPADRLTPEVEAMVYEVIACPQCSKQVC